MLKVTWPEVCGRRLRRSLLAAPAPAVGYPAAAGTMCGVQSQDPAAAEWGLGLRVAGGTQAGVRAAFWEERRLVRTYGLRGTVHVFAADELPLWMAAMAGHAEVTGDAWYGRAGLDEAQGDAIVAAIGEALQGRSLSRDELAAEVVARTGEWAAPVMRSLWGEALAPAAYAGVLCFAERSSGRAVYAQAHEWIGGWRDVDPQAALVETCRRYIRTYGPVTHQDLSRWLRVKASQARELLAAMGDEITQVSVIAEPGTLGQAAWVMSEDAGRDWEPAQPAVNLLPRYDAYVIAAGQRELIQPAAIKAWLTSPSLNRFEGATGLRVLLADGVIVGVWDRVEGASDMIVRVQPFAPLPGALEDLVEQAASRLGYYYAARASLEIAPAVIAG